MNTLTQKIPWQHSVNVPVREHGALTSECTFYLFFPRNLAESHSLACVRTLRMHVFYSTSLLLNWDVENEVILLKAWKKRRGHKQNMLRCRLIGIKKKKKKKNWGAAGVSAWRVCLWREEWTVCLWTRYMTRGQKAPHQYGRHSTCALTKKGHDLERRAGGRRKGEV